MLCVVRRGIPNANLKKKKTFSHHNRFLVEACFLLTCSFVLRSVLFFFLLFFLSFIHVCFHHFLHNAMQWDARCRAVNAVNAVNHSGVAFRFGSKRHTLICCKFCCDWLWPSIAVRFEYEQSGIGPWRVFIFCSDLFYLHNLKFHSFVWSSTGRDTINLITFVCNDGHWSEVLSLGLNVFATISPGPGVCEYGWTVVTTSTTSWAHSNRDELMKCRQISHWMMTLKAYNFI